MKYMIQTTIHVAFMRSMPTQFLASIILMNFRCLDVDVAAQRTPFLLGHLGRWRETHVHRYLHRPDVLVFLAILVI
jgi:hypothetical protein